jgi:hypothetical protein
VRVALFQSGTSRGPSYPVREIDVFEEPAAVVITVYARDGASKMARVTTAFEIPLESPLGDRRIFDGIHGERRPRVEANPDEGAPGWSCARALERAQPWTKPTTRSTD